MIRADKSCDPAVHCLCIRLAERCVEIIRGCLRDEEIRLAREEFYIALREELDKPVRAEEV